MANTLNDQWKEIAVLWSIKGYHFFKIRPHTMDVYPEEGNKYDSNTMKVVMPHSASDGMLQVVTRGCEKHGPAQKVKDILGSTSMKVNKSEECQQTYVGFFDNFFKNR